MTLRHTSLPWLLLGAICLCGCPDEDGNNTTNNTTPQKTVTCGEGTFLQDGKCLADAELAKCAEGTMLMDGECVRLFDGICAEGTTFDATSSTCKPNVVCGEDTIVKEGKCVTPDEMMMMPTYDGTETDDENDPAFNGTPQTIPLPAASDSFTLLGNLALPKDKDNDLFEDQDVDVYQISATAGDYLNVRILQEGKGSYGLEIHGPDGYVRQAPRYQNEPQRRLFLPSTGDYEIHVKPQSALYDRQAGPVGGADHTYVLVVENLGGFDVNKGTAYTVGNAEPLKGNFASSDDNLIKLEFPANTLMRLGLENLAETVQPAFILVDTSGKPIRDLGSNTQDLLLNSQQSNDTWLYVDYVSLSAKTLFTLRSSILNSQDFGAPLKVEEQRTKVDNIRINPRRDTYFNLDVALETTGGAPTPQGAVIRVDADLNDRNVAVSFEVFDPDNEKILFTAGVPFRFYASKAGRYIMRAVNEDENADQIITEIRLDSVAPQDLGTLDLSNDTSRTKTFSVEPGKPVYFSFDAKEALGADVSLTSPSMDTLSMSFFTSDFNLQATQTGASPIDFSSVIAPQSGRTIGIVANLGSTAADFTVKVDATQTVTPDAEPNDRITSPQPLAKDENLVFGHLEPGDVDVFRFTPDADASVVFRANTLSKRGSIRVEVLNANGEPLSAGGPSFSGAFAGATVSSGDPHTIIVSSTSDAAIPYSLFLDIDSSVQGLESEMNGDGASASGLRDAGQGVSEAIGTVSGFGDEDWYEINLPSETAVAIALEPYFDFDPLSRSLTIEAFAADTTTVIPIQSLTTLPSGKSYLRVRMRNNTGDGNAYKVSMTKINLDDLGTINSNDEVQRTGTFNAAGNAFFEFKTTTTLNAERLVVWSDQILTIYDNTGTLVHDSKDPGQFFGSRRDPSFDTTNLMPGSYFVTLEGMPNDNFELYVGRHAPVLETTMPNDTFANAQDLGDVTMASTPLLYFGEVASMTDTSDYYKFTITASKKVRIAQFQLGESVADIDLALHNDMDLDIAATFETPQIIERTLMPGTYAVRTFFVDDVTGMSSGEYLLRIEVSDP